MEGNGDVAPAPLEELHEGPVAEPRPAASAIVLREGSRGPEVLLVRRNPNARFMGGAWVFPGGAVQAGDDGPIATARRELEEEAGVRLDDAHELVPFSRWITPERVKVRFDTWFFLLEAPTGAEPVPDGSETVEVSWLRPQSALEEGRRGRLLLVFPTVKHLEQLAELDSVRAALDRARGREISPVLPRLVGHGEGTRVLLPGDPGYPA